MSKSENLYATARELILVASTPPSARLQASAAYRCLSNVPTGPDSTTPMVKLILTTWVPGGQWYLAIITRLSVMR